MGEIIIDYSEINSAAKKARSASGYFEDFEEELEKKVSKKLSGLPGSDSKGNIGNAKSIVSSKIKELRKKKKYYSDLASSLEKLADNIEYEEKSVVTDVRYIATEALELNRQSKWQAFCQWAYILFLKEVKRMAIYVEREGIEACITKIQNAIEQLQAAASEIDKTMGDLPTYWQGAAYDKAATTYIDEYQTLLTKTVPDSVDSFKQFINGCKDTIIDIDTQLSGQ